MKDVRNETTSVDSKNQKGGITAQNVTITNNHYSPFSKAGLGKISVSIKQKPLRWTAILAFCSVLIFGTNFILSPSPITTKEEFHQFLLRYQESVSESRQDAEDYFVDNISTFYKKHNIEPATVNEERLKSDYKDGQNKIDLNSITRRKAGDINYWRYKSAMICWRPSMGQFEKCMVEMEFGLNDDNRITSIRQIRYWDLEYSKDKPGW